jgi:hydroxymethylpyrimidine kinase/phosphomethylpyrimidine kinase/thiamine-phosphate diphosphorylase
MVRYIFQSDSPYIPNAMPRIWKNHSNFELLEQIYHFPNCGDLGLYPIVESSEWVRKLATYKIKSIQLRIKNMPLDEVEQEIIISIKIAKQYNLKLFINDYWELAIKHQAYGIHLGQEDLLTADLSLIRKNNLRLGISSHNHYELANATALNPSYIALGPIFPTTSKIMPWQPQGVERIKEWQMMINCPLVVIGGIGIENIDQVIQTGARNIAMISAITKSADPEQVMQFFLKKLVTNE